MESFMDDVTQIGNFGPPCPTLGSSFAIFLITGTKLLAPLPLFFCTICLYGGLLDYSILLKARHDELFLTCLTTT